MENYQMRRSGCRPYNRTCGMMPSPSSFSPTMHRDTSDYECLEQLAPTMAYVPYQRFTSAYDLNYALSVGTIFPQLCKPFCGKRGGRR